MSVIVGHNYVHGHGEGSTVSKIEGGESKVGIVRNASPWLQSNKNPPSGVRASNGSALGCACGQRKPSVTQRAIDNGFEVRWLTSSSTSATNLIF